jgi:hypothetical protein
MQARALYTSLVPAYDPHTSLVWCTSLVYEVWLVYGSYTRLAVVQCALERAAAMAAKRAEADESRRVALERAAANAAKRAEAESLMLDARRGDESAVLKVLALLPIAG